MRTLIGIAVVIGIFLTASVAVAKVYRCTPVNRYDCELQNCSRWQPMIQPLSMEYYYLLNSETGETTECFNRAINMKGEKCYKPRSNQVRKFDHGTASINWWDGEGGLHVISETDGSWYKFSQMMKQDIYNRKSSITGVTFGFCH